MEAPKSTEIRPPLRPGACGHGRAVVLEPNRLTRWSIATYLRNWFEVLATDSPEAAARMLNEAPAAALVISGDIPGAVAAEVEALAWQRNVAVRIVLAVADTGASQPCCCEITVLEKPFSLPQLARALGINDAADTTPKP